MTPFIVGFGHELIKIASDSRGRVELRHRGKGALRGAAIGAGTALTLPAAMALMLAPQGKRLRSARSAARTMVGMTPVKLRRGMSGDDVEMLRMVASLGSKATKAGALTGGIVGGALGNRHEKKADATQGRKHLFGRGYSSGGDPKKPTKAWGNPGGASFRDLLAVKPKQLKIEDTVTRDKPMTRVKSAPNERPKK